MKPTVSRKKGIIKIRVEVDIEKINKTKLVL